jgi:hypothetical protein
LVGALGVLAYGWFAPAKSYAGCGDGARSLNDHHEIEDWVKPLLSHAPLKKSDQPGKPCDGPSCSRNRAPMPAPVPPAPTTSVREWSWLASLPDNLSPASHLLPFDADTAHALRRAGSIFHPPRAS